MSLALPTTPRELNQSSWILMAFLLGPLSLLLLYWRVYFSFEVHAWSAKLALALSIPCYLLVMYRTKKLVARGLLTQWHNKSLGELKTHIAAGLACFVSLYGWSLCLWAVELVFSADHVQTRAYQVEELIQCSGKCSGCTYQLKPANWFGISSAKLCVTAETWSSLHVGDSIKAHGYFSPNVVYISHIQRG